MAINLDDLKPYIVDEIKKFVADYKAADAERLSKEKEKVTEAEAPSTGAAAMAKMTRPSSLI